MGVCRQWVLCYLLPDQHLTDGDPDCFLTKAALQHCPLLLYLFCAADLSHAQVLQLRGRDYYHTAARDVSCCFRVAAKWLTDDIGRAG
jgi:hypothetical protein